MTIRSHTNSGATQQAGGPRESNASSGEAEMCVSAIETKGVSISI